ncbi:MAG TPA: lipid II flippase MurJ [Trebonia sp.]|nr:lipid II flippase MurJ [Trebonia sp.]
MTPRVAERDGARQRAMGIGGAAVMIGVITVLARLVGFGRQVVFAHTVGTTCLGTAYTTANMVPNIIYDIVLGGALSAVVVPVLAGPAGAGGTGGAAVAQARQIASALLTWTAALLLPVSVALALAARPVVTLLLDNSGGCSRAAMTAVATRMLIVFAPQVLLYGLAVVLYGILQAHRRFGGPAVAPLLSSVVVVGTYAGFGVAGGAFVNRLGSLPPAAEYLLSGGTTLGVLAMVATAVVPAWRLRLGIRPTLRFPPGIAVRVWRLASAGVFTLIVQDASTAAVIVLANRYGSSGALVIYGFAWAVFVVPYAVLAVPIATSAFPELSARASSAGGFDATSAGSTRAVLLASWLGAAALIGARVPLARIFESHSGPAAAVLAMSLAAFAPGLVGYGLSANLSRVLYAQGRNRASALAVGAGWLLVIVFDLLIVPFVPAARVVPALGLGTSAGLSVAGLALLVLVRHLRGAGAVTGGLRAFLAGLAGCTVSAVAGSVVATFVSGSGFVANIGIALLVMLVIGLVFTAVAANLDGGDVKTALTRLATRLRGRVTAVRA